MHKNEKQSTSHLIFLAPHLLAPLLRCESLPAFLWNDFPRGFVHDLFVSEWSASRGVTGFLMEKTMNSQFVLHLETRRFFELLQKYYTQILYRVNLLK